MERRQNNEVLIDGSSLDLATLIAVARRSSEKGPRVSLCPEARKKVTAAHNYVMKLSQGNAAIYGVNTGFGLLSDVRIDSAKLEQLQINLLRSHACGMGEPLKRDVVRAALLLRANTLAKGYSGCSAELIDSILALIDREVVPWVPEQGSVGACGDLAPLAHLTLVLIGEGKAYHKGVLLDGASALKAAGLSPYRLKPKEGLSLINGTQIMTAIGALVIHDAIEAAQIADIAGAMSLEAYRGTKKAFHPRIHAIRPHFGQVEVAENLTKIMGESQIALSHANCGRVQDPYSFRCMPQVHGASRDFVRSALNHLVTEFNASTDNPLVFTPEEMLQQGALLDGGDIVSGGNFHGQYIAMAMDTVGIALSEFANISEIRIEKLINPTMSQLPAFLTPDPGLNSGMMIVQVAAASLVSENKILSHPAVVDSIPTSADKEDHVSMGVTAARKAATILCNLQKVLAMELLCASQAISFLRPLNSSKPIEVAIGEIRKFVPVIEQDRAFHIDIESILSIIQDGSFLRAVRAEVGSLWSAK
jgi:histidine ammonia-lyase